MNRQQNQISRWGRPATRPNFFLLLCALLFALPALAQEAPAKKQRIISSAPVVTEILFAIGAGDDVVGVDDFSKYPAEAAQRKSIGSLRSVNAEAVIALQPTLAVVYGQNPDLEALCKRLKIQTVSVMIESVEDFFKTTQALGEATGRAEQAARLVKDVQAQLEALKKKAEGKLAPRVLITVGRQMGSFQNVLTIGQGSFLDELVALAGGQNVFHEQKQPYPMISSEQIIAASPDVIIEFAGEAGEEKNADKKKQDWAIFKSIPAVKSGRIQFLSGDHLLIPGPRMGKVAEDLEKALNP